MSDRETFYAYVNAYRALRAGDDEAQAEQAAAEMLRLRCAELCAMAHTVPNPLPDSLMGDFARMMSGSQAEATARIIAPLNGSDSEVTETYHAAYARTLRDVMDLVESTSRGG